MKRPQLVASPVGLLLPCRIRVTGPQEGSPGSDHVLGALSPGEDQEAAWSTAHVMHQLFKCLLAREVKIVSQGRAHLPTGWEDSVSRLATCQYHGGCQVGGSEEQPHPGTQV